MDLVFLVGCKKRSVECVMDLPYPQEAELVSDGGENLDYYEGSFTFQGKFGVDDGAFEISGFQPDFVASGEGSESLVVVRGHDLAGKFMCSQSFILGSNEGL